VSPSGREPIYVPPRVATPTRGNSPGTTPAAPTTGTTPVRPAATAAGAPTAAPPSRSEPVATRTRIVQFDPPVDATLPERSPPTRQAPSTLATPASPWAQPPTDEPATGGSQLGGGGPAGGGPGPGGSLRGGAASGAGESAGVALGLARRSPPPAGYFGRTRSHYGWDSRGHRGHSAFWIGLGFGFGFSRPGFQLAVWLGDPWYFGPPTRYGYYWGPLPWQPYVVHSPWRVRNRWVAPWYDPFWTPHSWLLYPTPYELWVPAPSAFHLGWPIVEIWTVAPQPAPEPERCARVTVRTTAGTEYRFDLALPALEARTARELELTLERDLALGHAIELEGSDGVEFRLQPGVVEQLDVGACR
jgi:hypothetical protein